MNENLILLADKIKCTGCGACMDACSKSCITMVRDGLHDFPKIDTDKCIGCKRCVSVCPSINTLEGAEVERQKYYASWHKDIAAVKTSTSGGVGSALAEYAIDKGYYVVGSVLTNEGKVKHVIAKNKSEIQPFKGSKYVQSECYGIYKQCVKVLKEGHKILFIGTPCQTEAIKCFLPATMGDKLLTCSIICHGVNSFYIWNDYRIALEKKYHSHLIDYKFRCKSHGWQKKSGDANLRVSYKMISGKKVDVPSWKNLFHYWFGQHYIMRPSCFTCKYRTEERYSDIVIGDFWNVEKVLEGMDTFNGVSVLITTTSLGEDFIKDNPYLEITSVDAQKAKSALKGYINKKSTETQNKELLRAEKFATEYTQKGYEYMARKYSNPTYIKQCMNKLKSMIK